MEQFSFGEKDRYLSHCEERWLEKINNYPARLLELQEILNKDVPRDWRLARFSPDFLVEDLETNAVLVGSQYRSSASSMIIKEIYTVLKHGDCSRDKLDRSYPRAKAGRPNLIVCDDEVWARQYEKVASDKLKPASIQYFRMNKLSKEGLLKDERWLKWGNMITSEWVARQDIPMNYHGEDYWNLPVYRSTTR